MTYEEYKDKLKAEGWSVFQQYATIGVESGCVMVHSDDRHTLTVSREPDGRVVAEASVSILGLIDPVSTGEFSQPWSNKDFGVQIKRLVKLKQLVGSQLVK